MDIQPPGIADWLLLLVVGALAGAVNGLRSFAARGKAERAVVSTVEGATALFVTVTTFLVLHSLIPVIFEIAPPTLGLIGLSGVTAHIGLRQTIRMVLKATEKEG